MSTSRRGKGEGTITLRSDGRYMARVDMGRDEHGKRQRKTVYGRTRAECADKLARLLGQAADGELLSTSTPTVARLLEDWFDTHQSDWKPGTRRIYRCAIAAIVPVLGSTRVEQLKPLAVQRWANAATKNGPRASVTLAHVVLRAALKFAMRQRIVTYNAADMAKVARPKPKAVTPLTAEQGCKVIEAASGHRLGAMVIVSLGLGLRIGEASGLAWSDIDLDSRLLRVRRQVLANGTGLEIGELKTKNSRRDLLMPVFVADALKAQRVRQLQERLRAGEKWQNDADLLFTTESGRPLNPSVVRTALRAILKAADVDPIRYHGLRHSAATLLLADGTPLFDVSRVLGHSAIGITADTYGHFAAPMAAGAAARMDALLKKA